EPPKPGIEDARSILPATASWRRSTVRLVRSVVDGQLWKLGIHVRAGVHAGECEGIGEKLGGIAVHIGAAFALSQRSMKCWCLGRSVTLWRDQASDLKSAGPTA